jgi:OOP family OmpA-OmpF porin
MRRLALLSLAFGLACASTHSLPPVSITPLQPRPGEGVKVQQAVSLFDTSSTIVEGGHFPQQKAVYEGFVSGMPDGTYAAEAVAFGGYARQRRTLAPFSRADLAAHAAGIDPLREGTPIDRVLAETRASLAGKGERAAVILWSDGLPTDPVGRDVAADATLEQARALVGAYKGEVCFHTVQAGSDPGGTALLQQVANVTSCGTYRTLASVSDPASLANFEREVFLGAAPRMAGPGDEDQDGVTDDRDQCPRTPHGAKVDSRGCWTIADLQFDTSSSTIRPAGRQRIDQDVLPVLRANPNLRVRIDGHTDSRGSEAYNQALSERRAQAVVDYLVSAGIDSGRLTSQGFGESRPIAPNDTPENLQINRRTEITVLE